MKNKMNIVEFKNYIKKEAEKLYKIAILKEEKEKLEAKLSFLNESTPPLELGIALMDPEILKKVRQEMFEKASGWAVPEPKQQLEEEKNSEVQTYVFSLKHDNGTKKIQTTGSSMEAARKKIATAEGAPESALTLVK